MKKFSLTIFREGAPIAPITLECPSRACALIVAQNTLEQYRKYYPEIEFTYTVKTIR